MYPDIPRPGGRAFRGRPWSGPVGTGTPQDLPSTVVGGFSLPCAGPPPGGRDEEAWVRRIAMGWLAASSVAGTMLVGAPAVAQPVPDGTALEGLKVRLDRAASVPAEVTGWYTDVTGRALVVQALPGAAGTA